MASPERQNPSNEYLKYSNLALQLLIGIGAAGWLGHWLDGYLGFEFPVFMLTFGLVVFIGMIYQIYKSLNKE